MCGIHKLVFEGSRETLSWRENVGFRPQETAVAANIAPGLAWAVSSSLGRPVGRSECDLETGRNNVQK